MNGAAEPAGSRCVRNGFSAALDRRLNPMAAAPLAVAVSGGGDSVALLALAAGWARNRERRLLALTVDHGLQPQGPEWCAFTAELAARFGAEARTLRWTGPKPPTGLPAAARQTRHRLLADAAREAGASVVLTGHTADDVLEGEWMRGEGSTLGRLREWAPSPAWPEGRGVFLLRPLLALRRADLRVWLRDQGLPWVEDPANADLRFARARARAALADEAGPAGRAPPQTGQRDDRNTQRDERDTANETLRLRVTADGSVVAPRSVLLRPGGRRLAATALACVSGSAGGVRGGRLDALLARIRAGERFTATLGGGRIEAGDDAVRFGREAGEAARGGLAPVALTPGVPAVWDGRFELCTPAEGFTVAALKGRAGALPDAQRLELKAFPPSARPALPAVLGPDGVACPLLAPGPVRCRSLVADRLRAALGLVLREP